MDENQSNQCCRYHPLLVVPFLLIGLFVLTFVCLKFFGPIPLSVNSIITNKTDVFTVSGEGKVTAVPDMAMINLGITVQKPNVKEAQDEANSVINKISSDVKKLGIDQKDIKTTNYNVNPSYDWSSLNPKITGYSVNVNLEVKVKNFDKINDVIDTATKDGANLVGGLSFRVNDDKLKELQTEARKEAVKEAKEKAESLAQASGIKLGRIINVQENAPVPFYSRAVPMAAGLESKDQSSTQIQPGEQEITTTVSLSYEIN